MRYLIDGCYGDGNVGDECLLAAVVRLVKTADPQAEIAVFSSDAEATSRETSLPAVPQCNPFGKNVYGALCKGLLRQAIGEIRRADVFVLGGGELYRDHPGFTAVAGMFYRLALARRFGKRVLALGVGAQPAGRWWGRAVLSSALRAAESVVFRDADSLTVARELAGPLPRAAQLPDLVFSLDWEPFRAARRRRPIDGPSATIGVAVKSLPATHARHDDVHRRLPEALVEALERFAAGRPCRFQCLPFADADVDFARRLTDRLAERGLTVAAPAAPRIAELQSAVARLDALVALPLHASVFGFACGAPTLGLAYDLKIRRLYQQFQLDDHCYDPAQWQPAALAEGLENLFAARHAVAERQLEAARAAGRQVESALVPLLAGRSGPIAPALRSRNAPDARDAHRSLAG